MTAAESRTLRARLSRMLDPSARRRGLSALNLGLAVMIVLAVATAVVETEPTVAQGRARLFDGLELMFALVFGAEYLARLWIAPELRPNLSPWRARLAWMTSPGALIDLAALLPAVVLVGAEPAYVLRLLRLVRILRLAKLGRFSRAMAMMAEAIASRRLELLLAVALAGVVLIIASTLMYLVEGPSDPENFGSIPRAMWWAAVTLTTIGYGDVVPATPIGRVLAAMTAVAGIGLIAAPTGILAAAFSDAAVRRRAEAEAARRDEFLD